MTLSFSQKWPERMGADLAGQPNYFIEKIWAAIFDGDKVGAFESSKYGFMYYQKFGEHWDGRLDFGIPKPKLHTIREDKADRWHPGVDIEMTLDDDAPVEFQFAPVVKCVSVQDIEIRHLYPEESKMTWGYGHILFVVDGRRLHDFEIRTLAVNDGFSSAEEFFKYFDKDFKGKLIHWTDLKY